MCHDSDSVPIVDEHIGTRKQLNPSSPMNRQAPTQDRPVSVDDAPAVDVWHYVGIVRKRIWIITAVVAIGITAAVLYTKRQTRIYRATASVVINPTPPQVFGSKVQEVIQLGAGSYWSNQEYYNTQLQILVKYDLALKTIEAEPSLGAQLLALSKGTARLDDEQEFQAAMHFASILGASQNRESRVVNVHVQHEDPRLAMALANEHILTFYKHSKNIRQADGEDISEFLEEELQRAKQKLQDAEQALLKHKEEFDLLTVSLADKQNILAADIGRYTGALSNARIKRIELDGLRRRAQGLSSDDVMKSPIFALATNTSVVDILKTRYLEEKQRLAELAEEYGPKHPAYQSQERKVAEQLAAIQAEAKRAMRELDERYQAAITSERQFQREVERLKEEAFELGPKTVVYKQLEREFKGAEENYKVLLERVSASEFSERNEATNVSLHAKARGAVLVHPRLGMNLTIAGMLSLMLGLGLAFLLDIMDRTIKSIEDIERVVDAPLLGTIPRVDDSEFESVPREDWLKARDLYVNDNKNAPVAEHCRSIRTNILFSSANRPMKTLTISSPQKGEGKTTSTIYLGTIMAQSKQRVLLVDTDMRRPRLHFSLTDEKNIQEGLTSLLLPDTDLDSQLDKVIRKTEIPNLFLLPCGHKPPDPAELLLTERFKEVLAKLEERFDRVLLDSPPLMVMNDAVVLSRLSDGVVMVAQAYKTSIDHVARSAHMVQNVDAPILGVILNNIDPSDTRYGSYYYYSNEYYNAPRPEDEKSNRRKRANTDQAA